MSQCPSDGGALILAENLRQYLRQTGMTRQELSRKTGISVYCLRKIERGDPTVWIRSEYVYRLASVFGITAEQMMSREKDR